MECVSRQAGDAEVAFSSWVAVAIRILKRDCDRRVMKSDAGATLMQDSVLEIRNWRHDKERPTRFGRPVLGTLW